MTDHDRALLDRLRSSRRSAVVEADDPEAVAAALAGDGARRLPPGELGSWADEAAELRRRAGAVLAAEEVVAGAEAFEAGRRAVLLGSGAPPEPTPAPPVDGDGDDDDGDPDADRQAVRFSLAVLVPAQLAGVAVYVADQTLLAVVAPAVGLAIVLGVVLAHRAPRRGAGDHPPRPGVPETSSAASPASQHGTGVGAGVGAGATPGSPAVRAAEAHLRRQQAAWKLAWWERGLRPVDVATWVGRRDEGATAGLATLVVVDEGRAVDEPLVATMTAALPAAVRVVVVRSRPA